MSYAYDNGKLRLYDLTFIFKYVIIVSQYFDENKKRRIRKMKRILLVAVLVLSLSFCLPAMAKDRDAAAVTQMMISIDHLFAWENADQSFKLPLYASAIYMYNLNNGWPIMFGYFGPVISANNWNFYMLAVGMNDPSGWSVGPSLWLEYAGEKHYWFIEGDYYVPFLGTSHDKEVPLPPHAYYGFGEYAYSLDEKMAVGASWELFGVIDETRLAELAYGPFVKFNRLKVWCFYDETPNLPGVNYWGVRFKYGL